MSRRARLLVIAGLVACAPQRAAEPGAGAPAREIPFELRGGVVLLPVRVGRSRVLRVVLDTGMGFDGVILYGPLPESAVAGPKVEVRIPGAGTGEPARGMMAESADFRVGPVGFTGQRLVWLTDSTMSGFPSDGVMGYSLFGHWQVEFDYDRQALVLHEPGRFRPDSTWTALPLELRGNNVPWVKLRALVAAGEPVELDCYLDLAADEEVEFLVRDGAKLRMPDGLEPAYLGRGLSGDVRGWRGRAAWVELDTFRFSDLAVAFAPAEARSRQPGADAVIGGRLLGRLNAVYDYAGGRLYLRPRARR